MSSPIKFEAWIVRVGSKYLVNKRSYGWHALAEKKKIPSVNGCLLFKTKVAAKASLRSMCECYVEYPGRWKVKTCTNCRIGKVVKVQVEVTV